MAIKTLLLVVVSLAGYCLGAVVVRRRSGRYRVPTAPAVEVLIVFGALAIIAALPAPVRFLRWVPLCALTMFVLASVFTLMIRTTGQSPTAGMREFEDSAAVAANPWKAWLNFSRAIAEYEVRLILVAAYLVIVAPFAIAFRLFRRTELAGPESAWVTRSVPDTLESARRPF